MTVSEDLRSKAISEVFQRLRDGADAREVHEREGEDVVDALFRSLDDARGERDAINVAHQKIQNDLDRKLGAIEALALRAQAEREDLLSTLASTEQRNAKLVAQLAARSEKYQRLRRLIEQVITNSDSEREPITRQKIGELRNALDQVYYSDPAGV